LHLVATCSDAIFAYDILQQNKVDLIFLDIHLPKLKGLDFLETLPISPKVIITSAYNEYALKSYDYNVIDYLQKPIAFNRFLKAVNKTMPQLTETNSHLIPQVNTPPTEAPFLFLNVDKKKVKILLNDILYIESLREYIKISTLQKSILTKLQIGQIEQTLEKNNFIRVHRSYIVNKNKIEAYSASFLEINNVEIPIGRSYKELVQGVFGV
jgi:DNA-binding LytR/AlgR family response regulator